MENLLQISPVDSRYLEKTKELREYFSEFALNRYRLRVEIEYLISLCERHTPHFDLEIDLTPEETRFLKNI